MATKTLYIKDALAGTSQFGSLQDGGTAPTAATTATGWNTGQKTTGQSCLMDYAVEVSRTAGGWGTTLQPSAAPTNTTGDGWRTENPLTGTFANTSWSFSFLVRAVTLANTNLMRLRIRVWASTTQDFSSNVRELTVSTLTTGSTANPLSTTVDQTLTVSWSPGSLTLNNEYLLVQVGIEVTTGGSTGNNQDIDFRVGSSAITTPDFSSSTNSATNDTSTVIDSNSVTQQFNSIVSDSSTVSESNTTSATSFIALWKFNESGTPTVEADETTSWPLDITYGTGASFVTGADGNAFYMNGGSYCSRSFASGQAAWAGLVNSDFTIEGMVKDVQSYAAGYYPVLCADLSPRAGIYIRFGIRVMSPTDIRFWINRTPVGTDGYNETAAIAALATSGWHTVAVRKTTPSSTSYEFFVDGVSVATISGLTAHNPPASGAVMLSVGGGQNTAGTFVELWYGTLDTVRVSSKALSTTELLQVPTTNDSNAICVDGAVVRDLASVRGQSAYALVPFVLPETPGQIIIPGATGKPKAVIFLSTFTNIASTTDVTGGSRHSWGAATKRGGTVQQAASAVMSNHQVSTTVAKRYESNTACLIGLDNGAVPSVIAKVSFVDFTEDGCIVDVVTTPTTSNERNCWVLFISDIADAEVIPFTSPTAVGDLIVTAHFQPTAMLIGGTGADSLDILTAHSHVTTGLVAGIGKANQRLAGWRDADAQSTSRSMGISGQYALAESQPDNAVIYDSAYVSAWNSTSFTLTWDAKFNTIQRHYWALLLRGPQASVGDITFVADVNLTPSAVTGLQFKPALIFSANNGDTNTPSSTPSVFWTSPIAIGYVTGVTTGPGTDVRLDAYSRDSVLNTNAGRRMSTSGAFHSGDFNSHHITSSLATVTADGFTFNPTTGTGPMAGTSILPFLAFANSSLTEVTDTSTISDSNTVDVVAGSTTYDSINIDSSSVTDSSEILQTVASTNTSVISDTNNTIQDIHSAADSSITTDTPQTALRVATADVSAVIDSGSLSQTVPNVDSSSVTDPTVATSGILSGTTDSSTVVDSSSVTQSFVSRNIDGSTATDSSAVTRIFLSPTNDTVVTIDLDTTVSTVGSVDTSSISENVGSNVTSPNTVQVTDAVTAQEVNAVVQGTNTSDTSVVADSSNIAIKSVITDTSTIGESSSTVPITGTTDSSTVSESVGIRWSIAVADPISTSDSVPLEITVLSIDTGTVTDTTANAAGTNTTATDLVSVVDNTDVSSIYGSIDNLVVTDENNVVQIVGYSDTSSVGDVNFNWLISRDAPTVTTNDILERAMGVASRLIAKYGANLELVKFVDAAPTNPEKPWRIESTTSLVQTVRGVFLTARRTKYGLATDNQMDDFGMQGSEKRLLIAAQGLENSPNLRGEIRVGGDRWKIVSIQTVGPDNNAVLYTLQVRQ